MAAARFLVVRDQPMLALDIDGDAPAGPVLEPGLYRSLLESGLVVIESFYGTDLPRGARLGWVLEGGELRLETEDGQRLLRMDRDGVDDAWLVAARRLKGTMLVAGHGLDLDPDDSPREVADRVDVAARDRRVVGAIVGVGEANDPLPLIF